MPILKTFLPEPLACFAEDIINELKNLGWTSAEIKQAFCKAFEDDIEEAKEALNRANLKLAAE